MQRQTIVISGSAASTLGPPSSSVTSQSNLSTVSSPGNVTNVVSTLSSGSVPSASGNNPLQGPLTIVIVISTGKASRGSSASAWYDAYVSPWSDPLQLSLLPLRRHRVSLFRVQPAHPSVQYRLSQFYRHPLPPSRFSRATCLPTIHRSLVSVKLPSLASSLDQSWAVCCC